MRRWIFRYLFRLLLLAAVVFAAYAFFAELPPPTEPVTIEIDPPAPDTGAAGTAD